MKYVYAAADTDVDLPTASKTAESDREGDAADEAFPETETTDGQLTVTDGGETVYVARDEAESGTAASFFVTYEDAAHADQYGFYCSNCGSLDVSMGERDRLECAECGNAHAERSEQSDDDSYL
ncbi:DUF5816 domain-containing protein [Natrinema gari]|uniref:GCN5-like N-acetyltransferase n=1 Tax=Natrinema gari JCM 14663 TaxID=1230459 RepID=L9Z101_9EURY|nr:DUF5816 domain-containing protein [Natrinema gari]ELY80034.1 GCN5-like N-acetyltransferase [Natrinema gari JCM 14663]